MPQSSAKESCGRRSDRLDCWRLRIGSANYEPYTGRQMNRRCTFRQRRPSSEDSRCSSCKLDLKGELEEPAQNEQHIEGSRHCRCLQEMFYANIKSALHAEVRITFAPKLCSRWARLGHKNQCDNERDRLHGARCSRANNRT